MPNQEPALISLADSGAVYCLHLRPYRRGYDACSQDWQDACIPALIIARPGRSATHAGEISRPDLSSLSAECEWRRVPLLMLGQDATDSNVSLPTTLVSGRVWSGLVAEMGVRRKNPRSCWFGSDRLLSSSSMCRMGSPSQVGVTSKSTLTQSRPDSFVLSSDGLCCGHQYRMVR